MNKCVFCNLDRKPIKETEHMQLIYSKFEVTKSGHLLVITKRHIESFFDLDLYEWIELKELMDYGKHWLSCISGTGDLKFEGFNIGANIGEVAGQTVKHVHLHIIARVKGDVKDPRGGIRNIIPSKGNYLKK